MLMTRCLAATVFALAATVARADPIETAYDAGRYAEALALLEERGLEGDHEAQSMAGMMHLMGSALYGTEVATDAERGARWLRAAAVNGSIQAQFILAQLYEQGLGVPQDSDRAARWLGRVNGAAFEFMVAGLSQR